MDGVIISPVEVFFQVKFLSQVVYTKLVFDSSNELRSPKEDLLRGSLSCVIIPSTGSIVFVCHQPKPQKVRIGPGNNHLGANELAFRPTQNAIVSDRSLSRIVVRPERLDHKRVKVKGNPSFAYQYGYSSNVGGVVSG